MLKIITKLLKYSITGAFILYGYNLIATYTGYVVPINFITIPIVGFLGFPGLIGLLSFLIFVF